MKKEFGGNSVFAGGQSCRSFLFPSLPASWQVTSLPSLDSRFRVQGLGFWVQGFGFRVQGLGFRVYDQGSGGRQLAVSSLVSVGCDLPC